MAPRPLNAPREDGAILFSPPLEEVPALLRANRQIIAGHGPDLLDRPWPEIRQEARQTALDASRGYLRTAGEPLPTRLGEVFFLAGHQPELFHPGVWVKNFALHGLAVAHGGISLNLVVDNDIVKQNSLRIPMGVFPRAGPSDSSPYLGSVGFDRWTPEVPFEERRVMDEVFFASFAERARQPWPFESLLPAFWKEVCGQTARTPFLGERIARARRRLERNWGCENLEVPVSHLCRSLPFAWFAVHLLVHLPRWHVVYNSCLHHYRRRHGLRSRNHPVPDLGVEGEWYEAPFWAWRLGKERRGRLMVRRSSEGFQLRVGDQSWPTLPFGVTTKGPQLVAAWLGLEGKGFKVRCRALTTTMYARLFLADLFIHGIGGGQYDEVTDAIIRDFFGIEPPHYLIISATLLLPFPSHSGQPNDRGRLQARLRELTCNPQRHLDGASLQDPATAVLVRRKESLVKQEPADSRGRRQRFLELQRVTAALRQRLVPPLEEIRRQLEEYNRNLGANEVLHRRDFGFCLYPEKILRPFCTRFL